MKLEQTHTQQDFRKNNGENADNAACKTLKESFGKSLFVGALYFMGISLVYAIVALLAHLGDAQENILILTLIVAGIGAGLFQQIWFNYQPIILRLSYFQRYMAFNGCLLPMLVVLALMGRWLPNILEAWISFVGTYLVILLVMTLLFNQRFKHANAQYQEAFKKYQASRRA